MVLAFNVRPNHVAGSYPVVSPDTTRRPAGPPTYPRAQLTGLTHAWGSHLCNKCWQRRGWLSWKLGMHGDILSHWLYGMQVPRMSKTSFPSLIEPAIEY